MSAENTNEEKISKMETNQYFSVSSVKLAIMSICTFGLYELYWFYNNWVHIKNTQNPDIMPFWRTFFAPLWAFSAFRYIQNKANDEKLELNIYAAFLAIAYFIIQALWQLPNEYSLLSLLSFLPLMIANNATTKINEKEINNFVQNDKIKGWNWLAIILGGTLLIMSIIGTFMDPQS